ncbi:MAG: GMC family oxidoreductase N-terminal domain-containing protein [Hyphomicrobiaceae bacterium]
MSLDLKDANALERRYDAIVVGSGYGGAVAASHLARAGQRVCVLEQGRAFRAGDFPSRLGELLSEVEYRDGWIRLGSRLSLFHFRAGEDLHVMVGRGVGGGSLVNAAVAMRPDLAELKSRGWPVELVDDPAFIGGYERAEAMLGVSCDPDVAGDDNFKALATLAEAVGAKAEPVPCAIAFRARVNAAGVMQYACRRCGDCWYGCNIGAKTSVALTYLPDAVDHGAHIFQRTRVRQVVGTVDGLEVLVQPIDEKGRLVDGGERTVTAPLVILAAGALGSPEILLRSREAGLPVSHRVGEGFSANGDDLAFMSLLPHDVRAVALGHPPRRQDAAPPGANTTGMIRFPAEGDAPPMLLQGGMMAFVIAALAPIPQLFRLRLGRVWRMLRAGPFGGERARAQTLYIMGHDTAGGRVTLDRDTAAVSWPGVGDEPVFARAREILERAAERLGAEYVSNPLASFWMGRKRITVHPLGGCRIGRDAGDGVVDDRGRVYDARANSSARREPIPGLYVMDGSVMPGSLGANPLLTIAAFAERAMHLLSKERGWSETAPKQAPRVPRDAAQ